jgi:threonylcarbamoyladenosine tRNA methylthiotransferase MtaB
MEKSVVSFGCRLNTYESEVIRDLIQGIDGNVVVFNTCAVTSEAERQARQAIRKMRKEKPDIKIIVTGCSAQTSPKVYGDMNEVDLVLGNQEKLKKEFYTFDERLKVQVNDIMSVKETSLHFVSGFDEKSRAFLEIQMGCNHRCTFCIIPFGRGNSRSVPLGEIVDVSRKLVEEGYNEIVLTGVDLTSYGEDLPGNPTLGQMLKRYLALVPGLKRLRLSSLDPAEIDEDTFHLMATEPRLMPHFHISLQAGDDLILKRMKRRHLRHHVIEFCQKVRSLRKDAVFGADIIAGFPTESDEAFQNTVDLVKECNITYLHIFPYSPRPGTPAARMPQVKKETIKERARILRDLGKQQLDHFLLTQIGKEAIVLVERDQKAHTEHYAPVFLENIGQELVVGSLVKMRFEGVKKEKLVGKVV